MEFIKPDFERSIVNLSASIAAFLGAENDKPELIELSNALRGGYKNIVLLLLDGMGMHPLERNAAPNGFFRKNVTRVLTSVFPSTTTNATTSIQTNSYPMEHGWFGWCLYFGELKRAVNIIEDVDSYTGEAVPNGFSRRRLPTTPFYRRTSGEYEVNVVVPSFWQEEENRYAWTSVDELFSQLKQVCAKDGKQFVYAYCTQPDGVMHRFGVTSAEAKETIGALERGVEKFACEKKDTLLIVTADHGCDPSTPSTDHSREYVPMLVCGPGVKSGVDLGTRASFSDISATVLEYFGVDRGSTSGESFWKEVRK